MGSVRHASLRRLGMSASLAMILLAISALGNFGSGDASGGLGGTAALAAAEVERPNIVLITTDDQAVTDMAWMPKTKAALGGSGVSFSQGLSPHPLCCPARAEILTGQYAQNNGVHTNTGVFGGYGALKDRDNTLPAWLSAAGYKTAFTGKFMNGYDYETHGRPGGWDMWDPTIEGTYNYYGYTQANDGKPETYDELYVTDYVAQQSRSMINQWSAKPEPFFLWSSYVAPHNVCDSNVDGLKCASPPRPEPEYAALYPTAQNPAKSKPSYNESNVKDKPKLIRNQSIKSTAGMDAMFLARIRSLASVDDAVADTVAALKQAGEFDNTIILFTSDNGWLMGEHRWRGKRLGYEESLRVPFYIRGPGIPSGVSLSQVASLLDIAPTIMALSGASAGRTMDGRSLLNSLGQPAATDRQTRLIQAGNITSSLAGDRWDYRGVREKRYTYIRWTSGFVELYDRQRDPYQLKNLANKRRYKPIRKAMRNRLVALQSCSGVSECYRNFSAPPKRKPKK